MTAQDDSSSSDKDSPADGRSTPNVTAIGSEPLSRHAVAPAPKRWLVILAFGLVYVIWGSTYLGIRFAIETMPPFLMAGSRFLIAGALLYAFNRAKGLPGPSLLHWRNALITGILMLAMGNGGVTWAEQVAPSSAAALIVSLIPLWIVLFDWLGLGAPRPKRPVVIGLVAGFIGISILASGQTDGNARASIAAVLVLIVGSIAWAIGSLFNRHSARPVSSLMTVSMQMMCGGGALLAWGALLGEPQTLDISAISAKSWLAWAYLTVAGSMIAFTAYVWLLHVCAPSRVATYAYVNPVIAVILGCTLGDEPFSIELLIAGAMIVIAVSLIVTSGMAPRPAQGAK